MPLANITIRQKDRNMPEMTGAEALRRSLEAEGVDTVFALPGVQIMAAFDALHDSQAIRLVSTRHEQTTAYMADGYARVARKPGVALVVPGPGALNASAAVGTAYAVSSPVLLISGQIPSGSLGKPPDDADSVSVWPAICTPHQALIFDVGPFELVLVGGVARQLSRMHGCHAVQACATGLRSHDSHIQRRQTT